MSGKSMPSEGVDEGGKEYEDESLGEQASEALKEHLNQVTPQVKAVERASLEQPRALQKFVKLLESMDLSVDDLKSLLANFHLANGNFIKDKTGQLFASHLVNALKADLDKVSALPVAGAEIPSLEQAPQKFNGVRVDGDPYKFLLQHYATWLQGGRKCLDRPTLERIDGKLLKALQQRYTRGSDPSMPPLSEIFPGKVEAARNRKFYMAPTRGAG